MRAPQKVVLATGNAGKLRELQQLLGDEFQLIAQTELGITPIEETGTTFAANAMLKARHAAAVSGLPAIADDSGLEVDALDGAPGVRSARFAGTQNDDQANNALLLERLKGLAPAARTARFRCVIIYVTSAEDAQPLIADGEWEGRIGESEIGENGFGYDPLFIDVGSGQTSAQLAPETKNQRSHRGLAVRRLCEQLNSAAPDTHLD